MHGMHRDDSTCTCNNCATHPLIPCTVNNRCSLHSVAYFGTNICLNVIDSTHFKSVFALWHEERAPSYKALLNVIIGFSSI